MNKIKILSLLISFLYPSYTLACSCVYYSTEVAYKNSDVVFIGKVVSKSELCKDDPSNKNLDACFGPNVFLIKPTKVFKHPEDKTKLYTYESKKIISSPSNIEESLLERIKYKDVYIPQSISTCMVDFKIGKEYLIFATKKPEEPSFMNTTQCSGTRQVDKAEKTIKEIEEIKSNELGKKP